MVLTATGGRAKRGMALPLTVFALVVIGLLVAAALAVGRQELTVGRNTLRVQQAFAAAEVGLQRRVVRWVESGAGRMEVGGSLPFAGTAGGMGWYRGSVRRLSELTFLVRSEGFSPDSTARQQLGLLVRLQPVEIYARAAVSTRDVTRIAGRSFIDGNDHLPPGWVDCSPLRTALPGIRLANALDLSAAGCATQSCAAGLPPVLEDTTLRAGSPVGAADLAQLRAAATAVIPGGTLHIAPLIADGRCETTESSNWGSPVQPADPCGRHYPIVWSDGDLTVTGVQGQGVLVVNGDLTMEAGLEFYGLVIVTGQFRSEGIGGRVIGGLIAGDVVLDRQDGLAAAVVAYSSCALHRAAMESARAAPLRSRGWVRLF